jgi:hypothetical protein
MKSFLLFLTFVVFSYFSHSSEIHNCFPENNLFFPTYAKSKSTIEEQEFLKAIKDMQDLYEPLFLSEYNSTLKINGNWSDATVNAYANQTGSIWEVRMFGGLARHPETTLDGFRAVICHEIGHHIAGQPKKKTFMGSTWASNEGQSDYYATTKCLRKFYELEENRKETIALYRAAKNLSEEDEFALNKCKEVFQTQKERAVCFRSSMAGKSLARLLGSLRGNAEVKFSIPDPKVAATTNHNHPEAQCRMDTYFQGALCVNDHNELPSSSDVRKAYCTEIEKFTVGLRPSCWYKASEYEK